MIVTKFLRRRRRAARGVSGRQVLAAQAVVLGCLGVALFVKELPGITRELKIYRLTGGLRAARRYP